MISLSCSQDLATQLCQSQKAVLLRGNLVCREQSPPRTLLSTTTMDPHSYSRRVSIRSMPGYDNEPREERTRQWVVSHGTPDSQNAFNLPLTPKSIGRVDTPPLNIVRSRSLKKPTGDSNPLASSSRVLDAPAAQSSSKPMDQLPKLAIPSRSKSHRVSSIQGPRLYELPNL